MQKEVGSAVVALMAFVETELSSAAPDEARQGTLAPHPQLDFSGKALAPT